MVSETQRDTLYTQTHEQKVQYIEEWSCGYLVHCGTAKNEAWISRIDPRSLEREPFACSLSVHSCWLGPTPALLLLFTFSDLWVKVSSRKIFSRPSTYPGFIFPREKILFRHEDLWEVLCEWVGPEPNPTGNGRKEINRLHQLNSLISFHGYAEHLRAYMCQQVG